MPVAIPVGAELDERSATAVAERARRVFAEAGRDAGRSFSTGLGQAEEGMQKFERQARDSYDRAADAAGKLRAEEERLSSLRERGARNDQIVAQAERVEKARRAEVRAVRDATDAIRDYERAAEQAGRNGGQSFLAGFSGASAGLATVGQDAANEFVGGFMGASTAGRLATAAAGAGLTAGSAFVGAFAAAGAVAVAALVVSIRDGLPALQMQDVFATRMGIDSETMARHGAAASGAFVNGWGASVEDNLRPIQFGVQAGLIDPASSEAEMQRFVERMQTVSTVMEEDPQSIARGVRNFVKTGMVDSTEEAFDLLTAATQKGLNISSDLLDTFEEYGTKFRDIGISGREALGLINQMWEGGARNADVAADALKEFAISVVDDSDTTKTALLALGFDAETMAAHFAEGGTTARAAFGAVLTALSEVKDPMEQERIGLDLFKTKWEDLGDAIHNVDLATAGQELQNVSGATDTAAESVKKHANEWETLGRNIDQTFMTLKQRIADSDIGKFFWQGLPSGLNDILFQPPGFHPDIPPAAPGTAVSQDPLLAPYQPAADAAAPGGMAGTSPLDVFAPTVIPGGPAPGVPGPGPGMPYDDAKQAVDDAKKADSAAAAKPSFDPSQYSVDAIPVPGAPGVPMPGVAPAPGVPVPGAQGPGHYEVDPQRVYDAETSVMSARNSVEQARIRVLELEASGTATAQDLVAARNAVAMSERQYVSAQMKLAEAQQGTWKKMESAAKGFTSGMGEIGAALDSDLGISEGLPGLADNLVRFVASLAAAPLLGPLSAISAANPIQGGHGILGVLGAQGAFGPQYTQSQYAQSGYAAAGPVAMQPGYAGGQPYGLPAGSNSGGYGGAGVQFPPWVRAIEQAFNVKASTYGGHQTDNRNEPGYAPNPRGENRGIDWVGSVDAMQRLADYLAAMPGALEQVIWQNPNTGRSTEIAGGRHQPGYFSGDLAGHRDHVHTRQSQALPVPSGVAMPTAGANWNAIAQKESSGNWQANTGNGYYGGLQFLPSSWEAAGGTQYAPRADMASPGQQVATAENLLAMQGPGAWPNTFVPASPGGAGGSGIGFPGMGGPPQSVITPGVGGMAFPSQGGGGFDGVGGLPMDAIMTATQGLDMLAPGASQAAQIGIKLANRAIGYAGQVAGIGVSGLMETFLPSGSPLGNIGNSWFGKLAAGFAGARPALPNVAGQQAPPNPNAPQPGQPGQQQPGQPVQVEYHNHEATEDRAGADLARHLEANAAPTGVR